VRVAGASADGVPAYLKIFFQVSDIGFVRLA